MNKPDDSADQTAPYMPIDATGGTQPVLSGLTVLVPGVLVANHYRLTKADGRVGLASRWQAVDESLSRAVVVLAFANGAAALPVLAAAQQASVPTDARLLRIFDAGQDADDAYIVSEAPTGSSLADLLTYGGPLPGASAAWVVRQVAQTLASVQPLHLYHLCLSAANVFITPTGAVKLAGLMVEQALTPAVGGADLARSDMAQADAVGCGRLLYACLTATWPGDKVPGLASAVRTDSGYPSPLQLQPQTAPALNKLTYQMLSSAAPGHLTDVRQVDQALSAFLGTASAQDDLASRQRAQANGSPARPAGAKRPTIVHAGTAGDQPIPAVAAAAPVRAGLAATGLVDLAPDGLAPDGLTAEAAAADRLANGLSSDELVSGSSGDLTVALTGGDIPVAAGRAAGAPAAVAATAVAAAGGSGAIAAVPGAGNRDGGADAAAGNGRAESADGPGLPGGGLSGGPGASGGPAAGGGWPGTDSDSVTGVMAVEDADFQEDTGRLLADNKRLTGRQVRRWSIGFIVLVGLVILAVLTAIILGLYHSDRTAKPAATPTPITIVSARVFDPSNDGGDQQENDAMVPLAYDGNPTTGWTTENYHTADYIPSHKPGVGLVFDLGETRTITSLTVTVDALPTILGVYVPAADAATVTTPPMDSVASWQELTTVSPASKTTTLTLTATDSRFVLLYISQLPPAATGSPTDWALSIMEVTIG